MAKKIRVEVNTKPLQKLMNTLTAANRVRVKVGILSNKDSRNDNESNATIGALHEYGSLSRNIPERSFIKMPLTTKSNELVKEIKRLIQENLKAGSLIPLLKKVGIAAEGIIGDAFESGGFGTWDPISARTAKKKGSNAILIETAQLERSITSAVEVIG